MKFHKMQAAGNDFVVLDARDVRRDWSRLAIALCDRHLGVGADGLLLVAPSKRADYRMRMFNPDGSEAESCGNGLRCFVRYLVESGLLPASSSEIRIDTLGGVRRARPTVRKGAVRWVKVSMGKPILDPERVPVRLDQTGFGGIVEIMDGFNFPLHVGDRELGLTFVSMGNPHAVCFVGEPLAGFPLSAVGPQVECHWIFPRRTNFEVARVLNRREIDARVWERGAGETLACGTGASAIGVAALLLKQVDSPVDIMLPGGTLTVEWDGRGEVWLSGPVETVFAGEWPEKR